MSRGACPGGLSVLRHVLQVQMQYDSGKIGLERRNSPDLATSVYNLYLQNRRRRHFSFVGRCPCVIPAEVSAVSIASLGQKF